MNNDVIEKRYKEYLLKVEKVPDYANRTIIVGFIFLIGLIVFIINNEYLYSIDLNGISLAEVIILTFFGLWFLFMFSGFLKRTRELSNLEIEYKVVIESYKGLLKSVGKKGINFNINGINNQNINESRFNDDNNLRGKLKEIESLYQENLLSEEEYELKRKQIIEKH